LPASKLNRFGGAAELFDILADEACRLMRQPAVVRSTSGEDKRADVGPLLLSILATCSPQRHASGGFASKPMRVLVLGSVAKNCGCSPVTGQSSAVCGEHRPAYSALISCRWGWADPAMLFPDPFDRSHEAVLPENLLNLRKSSEGRHAVCDRMRALSSAVSSALSHSPRSSRTAPRRSSKRSVPGLCG
jgi:hypothetical protein